MENLCNANFTLKNTQRENALLTLKTEEFGAQAETAHLTLKYAKDKIAELESRLETCLQENKALKT